MWTYDFKEYGGYDGMSAGFVVSRDGREMFVIDVSEYDDGARPDGSDWDWQHRRCQVAEAVARAVCQRMNA